MSHKTVFISGSSRGIGKSIAIKYASMGYNVIINASTSNDDLLDVKKSIEQYPVKCLALLTDVSNYEKVSDMFKIIYNQFEKIDVVINNAGISHIGLFTELSPATWHHILNTNLTSIYNILQFVLPNMIHNKSGSIINISSIWGIDGASCEVAYSTSKGAVNALTKALAKELGPSHIRINAIACGAIDTPMNNWMSKEDRQLLQEDIALCRFGKPEEVANLAFFLGSDASSYLTGEIIRLDGGI